MGVSIPTVDTLYCTDPKPTAQQFHFPGSRIARMHTRTEVAAALEERVRAELRPDLEVVRALGAGTTAHVYLAREAALQRLVAVKVLLPDVAADPILRQRFEREAQSAARIAHPNVTAIHRIGHLSDGVPYIVLEYVEGRTLRDVIDSGVSLDLPQARAVLASVAAALAAAHDRGIVHRDVRPGNVLLERTGRAVLGDFGLAALLESGASPNARLTAVGVRLGDARYMSPEHIRGEPVVEQSDVYSFGILAWELLTGAGPYEAKGDAQLMAAHLQQEPRKLLAVRAELDPTLAALIDTCLARDPNRRPLARDLTARLSTSVPQVAAPAVAPAPELERSTFDRFVHELRRRRVYQVVAAYGALALAALGLSQGANDAGLMSNDNYRRLVATILAGFPVALVLSWIFDLRNGRIKRTQSGVHSRSMRFLIWGALAVVGGVVALTAWLVLRGAR